MSARSMDGMFSDDEEELPTWPNRQETHPSPIDTALEEALSSRCKLGPEARHFALCKVFREDRARTLARWADKWSAFHVARYLVQSMFATGHAPRALAVLDGKFDSDACSAWMHRVFASRSMDAWEQLHGSLTKLLMKYPGVIFDSEDDSRARIGTWPDVVMGRWFESPDGFDRGRWMNLPVDALTVPKAFEWKYRNPEGEVEISDEPTVTLFLGTTWDDALDIVENGLRRDHTPHGMLGTGLYLHTQYWTARNQALHLFRKRQWEERESDPSKQGMKNPVVVCLTLRETTAFQVLTHFALDVSDPGSAAEWEELVQWRSGEQPEGRAPTRRNRFVRNPPRTDVFLSPLPGNLVRWLRRESPRLKSLEESIHFPDETLPLEDLPAPKQFFFSANAPSHTGFRMLCDEFCLSLVHLFQ